MVSINVNFLRVNLKKMDNTFTQELQTLVYGLDRRSHVTWMDGCSFTPDVTVCPSHQVFPALMFLATALVLFW
jgi:hypothetical protein